MFRLVQTVLYAVAMLALAGLLWQIVPVLTARLDGLFGFWPVTIAVAALIGGAGLWSFIQHRKHPEWSISYRRQDAGKFLEPRDP